MWKDDESARASRRIAEGGERGPAEAVRRHEVALRLELALQPEALRLIGTLLERIAGLSSGQVAEIMGDILGGGAGGPPAPAGDGGEARFGLVKRPPPQPLPIPADRPPAVDPGRSVLPDRLICLEDGREMRMLTRYLRGRYGLTPAQYRARWGLPADYPMIAPEHARRRSEAARRRFAARHADASEAA